MFGSNAPGAWPCMKPRTWTKRRCSEPLSTSPGLWAWTRQAPRLSMPVSMTARGLPSVFRPRVLKSLSPCAVSGSGPFSADDLVKLGSLPEDVKKEAERTLHSRRNILVSGGTGSGKTTLLNALIELLAR